MKAIAGADIKPGMTVVLAPGEDSFRVSRVEPMSAADTWVRVFNEDGFPDAVRKAQWYAAVES